MFAVQSLTVVFLLSSLGNQSKTRLCLRGNIQSMHGAELSQWELVSYTCSSSEQTGSNLELKLLCDESGNLYSTFYLHYTEKQLHEPLNMHKVLAYRIKDILGNNSIPALHVATITLPFDSLVYQAGLADSGVAVKGTGDAPGFKSITSYSSLNWLLGEHWQVRVGPEWRQGKTLHFSYVELESVRYCFSKPEAIVEHHPGDVTMTTKTGSGTLMLQFKR